MGGHSGSISIGIGIGKVEVKSPMGKTFRLTAEAGLDTVVGLLDPSFHTVGGNVRLGYRTS